MIEPVRRGQRVGEQRREPQRREDVGLVGGPQRLDRDRGDRVHRRDAERVVDQAVDPAELLERLRSTRPTRDSSSVMSVGTTSARRPCDADHLGHLLQPSLGAAGEHQVGAHPGRLLAQRAAQARADTGEDDDLVLQEGDGLVGVGDGRRVVGRGGGHGARLERVSVLVETEWRTRSVRNRLLLWPVGVYSDQGTRPRTRGTDFAALVERTGGLFSGCWCVHFHHGVPDGRGEDETEPRLQATAWSSRASRTPRWSTTATSRWPGPSSGGPDELPNIHHRKQYDAETAASDSPPDYRITCINVTKTPPQAGATGGPRSAARCDLIARGRRRCRRGLPARHGRRATRPRR